ncbi:UNVERIFIED_CONTAM: hypothetical protein PYX00_004798 [Menopon gallinae]|uniref:ATP-dependent RNA helicase DHX34 n=1 Tax=Menopon gallinae TaxID=328185 RepID=A0AAW2I6Z8_9NEOP
MSSHRSHSEKRSHSKSERNEKRRKFEYSDYKHELLSLLRRYELIHEHEDFWRFLLKYEKMKRPQTVDRNDLICFNLNITAEDMLKQVTSRSIDENVLNDFISVIHAYLNFKQIEKFNLMKKIRKTQSELPVSAFEEEITNVIRERKVTIIAGDTGCGKSTQIPQYLMKNGFKSIVCTQPRRLACISLCSRLKYETLNQHNSTIGYQIRFEKSKNKDTKILFLTEGLLVRQMIADPILSSYDVVILDEVHERHLQSDFLLGLLKCLLTKRDDLKVVLMSATININLFYNYFQGVAKIIQIPGRLYPVKVVYKPPAVLDQDKRRAKVDATPYLQIMQIIDEKYRGEKGDLLIFMSGMAEIMCLADAIGEYKKKSPNWIVLPLHSSLALADQDKVFDYPPEGYRKCIISTNIAETSITIDGIRFVIDSGKVKEMSYDSVYKVQRLKEFWISRSSAEQRKGRAGRTGPGTCYRIYSEKDYAAFDEYSTPEIKRVPLDSVLLQMIGMGLPDVRKFPFLEDPNSENIENCIISLKQQNALTHDEKITDIGKTLTNLPVELTIGKMLIIGSIFRQVGTTIALASALSIPSPYTNNAFRDADSESLRKEFESDHGDCITLINLFREWLNMKKIKEDSRRWCRKRGLEEQRFYEMTKLIDQFKEILTESKLMEMNEAKAESSNERRIRHGEVKILKRMKMEQSKKPERKRLKVENYQIEDEKMEVDVKDIEFRLRNDGGKVVELLNNVNVATFKNLTIIKIVYCSGFYPQFAIADEFNTCRSDQLFHTKTKSHVSLHPMSHFGLHPNILKLEDGDIVIPNTKIKYNGKQFSSKHKTICYSSLLETNKIYLTNMIQMPALQCFLFFAKTIDTSFNLSKLICDNWVLFEILNPRQSEKIIIKLIELRKSWNRLITQRLAENIDTTAVDKLTEELLAFMNTDIIYAMKRLLPADLKYLYSEIKDFEMKENFFDPDFELKENPKKGGVFVTDYLTYNCILPNEYEDCYESEDFECRNCDSTFNFNCVERLEHVSKCKKGQEEEKEECVKRLPNAKEYTCESCGKLLYLTTVEILRHKKKCR